MAPQQREISHNAEQPSHASKWVPSYFGLSAALTRWEVIIVGNESASIISHFSPVYFREKARKEKQTIKEINFQNRTD
jgi:hypothetical protein